MIDDGVASLEQAAEARWLAAWLAGPKRRGYPFPIHRAQYCEDFPAKTVLLGAIAAGRSGPSA